MPNRHITKQSFCVEPSGRKIAPYYMLLYTHHCVYVGSLISWFKVDGEAANHPSTELTKTTDLTLIGPSSFCEPLGILQAKLLLAVRSSLVSCVCACSSVGLYD